MTVSERTARSKAGKMNVQSEMRLAKNHSEKDSIL